MAVQFFIADKFNFHLASKELDLINDTIKVALVANFAPTYSSWAGTTSYSEGDIVIPTTRNGRRYRARNAGTSGSGEPSWPTTDEATVSDNDITWEEYGGEHCDMEYFSEVSANEVSDGNGYTIGGEEITSKALSQITTNPAKISWDGEDVQWSGLTKTFRTGFIYKVTDGSPGSPGNDYIIGYILADDTPADINVTGVNFAFLFNAAGIYHFTK